MSDNGEGPSSAQPRWVPTGTSGSSIRSGRSASPATGRSLTRQASIARLASPIPSPSNAGSRSPVRREPTPDRYQDLPTLENASSLPGPGPSALSSAVQESLRRSPSRSATPPRRTASPAVQQNTWVDKLARTNYGSYDNKADGSVYSGTAPYEDPEVVKRHLVLPQNVTDGRGFKPGEIDDDEFSSLKLQGGDITRQVYRWTEEAEAQSLRSRRHARSRSFTLNRPEPESETMNINSIRVPGGFRRDYLRRTAGSPAPHAVHGTPAPAQRQAEPQFLTSSFLEFLTLYGHFAGEELEEDDEVLEPDEYFSDTYEGAYGPEERVPGEESALLHPDTHGKRRRKHKERAVAGTTSTSGAAMLLLKSFVGTGVLFLPRAFMNGGMLFSSVVLTAVSLVSYYCFVLLVKSRMKVEGSFGDIGGVLYGKQMRRIILGSIVVSQLGFVAAYTVFTAENLKAFVLAVSKCKTFVDIKYMILLQLIIFLPLSLVRDISKLGFTALIADAFIVLGLIILYYYDIAAIVEQHGVADIQPFNPSTWTLFIGTAIFTYEGIGLIIPIQESMKRPEKFPHVLAGVIVGITVVFLTAGALGYAAYGSATKTVVILNLPQESKFVNAAQFMYSLAILLSTPLQLFPAIRILENELFTRSGKYHPGIKWKKNFFRFSLVMLCAFIAWGGASDLDKFVALIGSFACVPLVYVYPPMLHLRACAQSRRQQIADIALACFGVIGCVYTTTLTIYNWINAQPDTTPGYCDSK
ncbi:hypothetical protein VTN02DRAFT_1820 [Thermoascus thermophilus]